jgi:hypothetical protein
MFEIKTIDNWLSNEERESISNRINGQRHNWKHIRDFPLAKSISLLSTQNPDLYKSAENQYFLGDATYVLENLAQRNLELEIVLNYKFEDVYNKILETIKQVTGLPTSYASGFPRPGFHIFKGIQTPHPFEYHVDTTICRYDSRYSPNNCYSFLSLIESPADPAGLEYKDTTDWELKDQVPEKTFIYNTNSLYLWKGDSLHRMKKFKMNEGETRITLQGHYVIHNYETLIYW